MKKIEINIPPKAYPVFVGENIFDRLTNILRAKKLNRNVFVIIDRKVFDLHRAKINMFVSNWVGKVYVHHFDSDESNKGFIALAKIFDDLINKGFGRDTLIISVGGGITGDIAGFAAATFARGVQFVQAPTTLLAAVDSSVGGKTGINFGETKNIIGAFYQPKLVLIDTEFLKTLPTAEIVCGIGEVVKYVFLTDQKFFNLLKNNFEKLLQFETSFTKRVIETCIKFKGNVVTNDEKENSLRKILNLGHTFAHAIEIEQNYLVKHGEAVVIGLVCVLELSKRIGILNDKLFREFIELPLMFKNKIAIGNVDAVRIYDIMKRDKKGRDEKIKFVLIKNIGNVLIDVEANEADVLSSIQQGIGYFKK